MARVSSACLARSVSKIRTALWAASLAVSIFSCNPLQPGIPGHTTRSDNPALLLQHDTLFLNGKPYNGYVIGYHENGDTAWWQGRLQGIEHGPSQSWYPDGRLKESREFRQGLKIGIHKGWWPNGNPRFEYHFKEGEHHGPLLEWYEDGSPYKSFQYRMGYEDGAQKLWWENGVLRANYVVRNHRRYGMIGLKRCSNPIDSLKKK